MNDMDSMDIAQLYEIVLPITIQRLQVASEGLLLLTYYPPQGTMDKVCLATYIAVIRDCIDYLGGHHVP